MIKYIAKNVIKTLEPLIDGFINEKILSLDQKLIELTNRLDYSTKSLEIKLDIY
jgi:hypothetical protein